ncbi:hypothetical protein H8959_014695 [Pygathrix nigripes]
MGNRRGFHGCVSSGIWAVVAAVDGTGAEATELPEARPRMTGCPSLSWASWSRTRRSGQGFEDYNGAEADPRQPVYQVQTFVAIGDYDSHFGLGVKRSKEVVTAICRTVILAKLSIVPMCRGYWGNKISKPYTVPCKVTGRCSSLLVHLIPEFRDTGIVLAPEPKKLLMMTGIDDCYTSARGCTATLGNFAKAIFDAISKTYSYLTLDLWKETVFTKFPYQEFTDHLFKTHTRVSMQRTQAPAVATT